MNYCIPRIQIRESDYAKWFSKELKTYYINNKYI